MREFWSSLKFWITDTFASRGHAVLGRPTPRLLDARGELGVVVGPANYCRRISESGH